MQTENRSRRFTWNADRDRDLTLCYRHASIEQLEAIIGCKRRAIYKRIAELNLPPTDPVRRAIAAGESPPAAYSRDGVSLPTPAWLCNWMSRDEAAHDSIIFVSPAGVAIPAAAGAH